MEFSEEIENKATEFGLSNKEGALYILEHQGDHYWSIEGFDGFYWEKIPKSLYDELTKYEAERVSSMAPNKNLTQDLVDLAKAIEFKVDDVVFFVAKKGGYSGLNDIAFKAPRMSVVRSIDFHCVKDKSYCLVKLGDNKYSDYVTADPEFIFPEREYKKAIKKLEELNQGEEQ